MAASADPAVAEVRSRPLRADAQRNRDQLLATAAALFAEKGADAPLEEIARRAEVGIGTLYRHFPTRDALLEAVYRRELDLVCDPVDELLATNPPDVALATWMRNFVDYVAIKRGMATALKAALGAESDLFVHSQQRIRAALGRLLDAAIDAGTIRADVELEDVLRALGGICMATDTPGWTDRTARVVGLFTDGLRYGAGSAPPPAQSLPPARRRTESGTRTSGRRSGARTGSS